LRDAGAGDQDPGSTSLTLESERSTQEAGLELAAFVELCSEQSEGAMSPRTFPTSSAPKPLLSNSSSGLAEGIRRWSEKGAESGDRSDLVKEVSREEEALKRTSGSFSLFLNGHMDITSWRKRAAE